MFGGGGELDVMEMRRRIMMNKLKAVNINIWDEEWEIGAFSTSSGLPATITESTLQIRTKNHIPVVSGTSYYIFSGSNVNIRCLFYKNDDSFITSPSAIRNTTITAPANAAYMRFYTGNGYGRTYKNDISINYPPTETGYHKHI